MQRGLPMMRPPFPGPMRMPMRGPPPPVPMGVRPVMEGQSPVPFPTPGGHPGVMPPHPMQHPPQPHVEVSKQHSLLHYRSIMPTTLQP